MTLLVSTHRPQKYATQAATSKQIDFQDPRSDVAEPAAEYRLRAKFFEPVPMRSGQARETLYLCVDITSSRYTARPFYK